MPLEWLKDSVLKPTLAPDSLLFVWNNKPEKNGKNKFLAFQREPEQEACSLYKIKLYYY